MVGQSQFYCQHFQPAAEEQIAAVRLVKNMMVQAAVVEVVERAGVKLLHRSRPWIDTEIVFLQNFRQVKQVVFASLILEVLKHVVDRRGRSLMIERSAMIRQKYDQAAAGPGHSFPLMERLDRIGEVFKIVRGQNKVVAMIRYAR